MMRMILEKFSDSVSFGAALLKVYKKHVRLSFYGGLNLNKLSFSK